MVHEHAAGFALHALEPDEVAAFERHLQVCPECEVALEPLMATAAALAFVGDGSPPPPALRLRVLDVGAAVIPLRRRWRGSMLAAVAVAAACGAIVLGIERSGGGTFRSVTGLHAYDVRGAQGALLVGRGGEALLVARGLPSPPAGTAYELWIVAGRDATPAGFLRGGLGMLTRPVPAGASVAVSLEPAGGSTRPTGPLLVTAETA